MLVPSLQPLDIGRARVASGRPIWSLVLRWGHGQRRSGTFARAAAAAAVAAGAGDSLHCGLCGGPGPGCCRSGCGPAFGRRPVCCRFEWNGGRGVVGVAVERVLDSEGAGTITRAGAFCFPSAKEIFWGSFSLPGR